MAVFEANKLFDKEKTDKSLKSTVWETPENVFQTMNKEFNFTIDVCALPENSKCKRFFSPIENGLKQSWKNEICWCNPPYGKEVKDWVKKAYLESFNGAKTVLLIPVKSNTNWWHEFIIPFAEVRFVKGRIAFIKDGVQFKEALPFPLAFVIFNTKVKHDLFN
jgi:phage N-6-adenine-methyltransferase